jgi:hypothetical protein
MLGVIAPSPATTYMSAAACRLVVASSAVPPKVRAANRPPRSCTALMGAPGRGPGTVSNDCTCKAQDIQEGVQKGPDL